MPDTARWLELLLVVSLPDFLDEVVAHAAGVDGDRLSCGLTVQAGEGSPLTFASSDANARRLDQEQYAQLDGPCVRALHSGEIVAIEDVSTHTRWPWFTEQARAIGIRASLSVPLYTRTGTIGALNLYQRADDEFTTEDRDRAVAFAHQAAPAVEVAMRLAQQGTVGTLHPGHPVEPQAPYADRTSVPEDVEQLRELAVHDDLTGLANRRGIARMLDEFLEDGIRERVGVLFCDLDNFKRINDAMGHEAGDALLVTLAQRLRAGLPQECTAGRISGDEFVIVCSDVEAVGGIDALTNLVAELLSGTMPLHRTLVEVTASVGAAMVTGAGITSGDLMRFADAAMFEAKDRGAGSVAVSNPALITAVNRQLVLEGDLRQALDQGEVVVHYQPIVDRSGTILMAEALMRWPHPNYGSLSPEVILETAQRGNLLSRLDAYVLSAATREAAAWSTITSHPPSVAVNLATLPENPDFADHIKRTMDDAGLPWTRLVLEITETPLAGLTDTSRQAMIGLAGRGMRFAIDDFGTGYSSLSRLEQLPIQIIKLDGGFTANLIHTTARAISTAVASIAASIGHTSIAEGVETAAQLETLDHLGYHAYQGWLISPAIPAHEFRTLLDHTPLPMPTRQLST